MIAGWALSALIAGATVAGVLHAQEAPNQGAPGERTGPNAQPPPLPSFATPKQMLPPLPPPPVAREAGAAVLFSDVQIDQSASRFPARAAHDLRADRTPGGEMRISYARGEALDAGWVRRQFTDNHLIGIETSPGRIVELILLINRAYVSNGYINSGLLVPGQGWPASGAVLRLQLVAGRVVAGAPGEPAAVVSWKDNRSRGLTRDYILERMPAASRWPLDAAALEQQFRLLADDPAIRTINTQLAPGPLPGEATMTIFVDPQPRYDLYASLADSRSPSVGGVRAAVGGSMRNTVVAGDVLGGEYGVTSGLSDGSAYYSMPAFAPKVSLDARVAIDNAAVVDASLRALNIRSRESSFAVGFSDKLVDTPLTPKPNGLGWIPARSLTLGYHFEHRDSYSTLLGQPFSFSPGAVDGRSALDVVRASADFVERGERQVIAASATASLGLYGTGTDLVGVATPDYNSTTVLAQINYARRLGEGGLEVRARAAGQWASGLLNSMERFSVGGQDSVRGYRENLLLADAGALVSVELSCPLGLGAWRCNARTEDWKSVRLGLFTDGAIITNRVAPQPSPRSIASAGVSLTWTPANTFFARLTYAKALIAAPITGPLDLQDRGFAFQLILYPIPFARWAFR